MSNLYVSDYISALERDKAYEFINMLLAALPISKNEKLDTIEGTEVKLTYNRTKLKKEANFYIKVDGEFYTAKYIHSKLNHYDESISNIMTAFILNNEKQVEKFIID